MAIARGLQITGVLVCQSPPQKRRVARHAGYYLLRFTTMRTPAQRSVP